MIIMIILFIALGGYGLTNISKKFNEQLNITANTSYISGLKQGTEQGIILGKAQCPQCPTCTINNCSVCESPNQTVLNLAKEQTFTSNIILYNGTHIVSLPLNQLCIQLQLQNGTNSS
jgi:hypothetical protein